MVIEYNDFQLTDQQVADITEFMGRRNLRAYLKENESRPTDIEPFFVLTDEEKEKYRRVEYARYLRNFKEESTYGLNGHEAIDLGLNSENGNHLLWAKCNVGATTESESGLYFAWGDTEGFTADEVSGKFNSSWYSTRPGSTLTSDITPEGGYDAARENMGGSWRMPTSLDIYNIAVYQNRTWTTINGVNGYKIVNKDDSSQYVFFPAVGDGNNGNMVGVNIRGNYWSSTYKNSSAYNLYSTSSNFGRIYSDRYYGFPVKGVIELTEKEYQDWLAKQ